MVYGFAKQSGGHVRIESEVGRGTVARLYLPRADAAPTKAPKMAPFRSHPPGKGETILVVEDDRAVRRLVTGMLRSLGYETLEAEDAESGLAVLADAPEIDLLFSDVVLSSGPNGPEMAREARELRPGLRVLFMSGFVEGVEGFEEPALDGAGLIQKPFRKAELAEALRAALA
jgi:CheY-like chemotaxis protein